MATARQTELGDFLRSRRQKLTPKLNGAQAGRRRRTPGLRREEVAELAGIGVDWYIRLEQGRSVSPSATTIDALARALSSDVIKRMREDFLRFPPFAGGNKHFPMLTTTVRPGTAHP